MAVKIGGNSFKTPKQSVRLPQPRTTIFTAAQRITGVSMAGFPVNILLGSFWQIPSISPGVKLYLHSISYHVRVEVTATGAEYNGTAYSRALIGSIDPINTNDVFNGYLIDGNNPHINFVQPLPINYDVTTGILFSVRMFANQIPGYVYTAGDTAEVDAAMSFSL